MNTKTIIPVFLLLSILFSGCASEIEYWTKRMQESKKESAEKDAKMKAEETKADETKQAVVTPPAPVAPPVTWPPPEKTSTAQQPIQPEIQVPAQVTPAISSSEIATEQLPTKATFTINIKGGEKYIGEILLDEISFKSTHGIINVKPENITSFVDGRIQMKDGTSIKCNIDQETIKIKTSLLGELDINTTDIESITR